MARSGLQTVNPSILDDLALRWAILAVIWENQ